LLLDDFALASEPGNDRLAADRVADAVSGLHVSPRRLQNLCTAVAEATLNAIEHGNHFAPDKPVRVRVESSDDEICVTVADLGGGRAHAAVAPDLEAKLRGEQSPRGWGLFLIRHMVDDCSDETEGQIHRVHLRLRLD
jgi:anti-sigma regulatory factor (Ser/Thr protein kinase)